MAQSVEQLIRNQQVKGSSPFIGSIFRGVAQFGSAFGSGPKGRRFKSCHLDQKNGRKSSDFRLFLMQFAQRRVFGTFSLQLFCNLSKYTKRPQTSIYREFAISRHNILHFSKRPSQFARKRHRLEQPRPAALPSLICRFVWKSPCPPGEPPPPAAHN